MCWLRRRSSSGCSATRSSSSPTSSACTAEGQVGVDALLQGVQTELLEPTDLGLRPRVEGEVEERRSTPEREGLPQLPRRGRRVGPSRLGHEALEAVRVEAAGLDAKLVSRRPRRDRAVAKRATELGDVRLQDLRRRGRRLLGPESLDQPVARDLLVRVEQQDREQRSWLRCAQRDGIAFGDSFERPEDAELHLRQSVSERSTRRLPRRAGCTGSLPLLDRPRPAVSCRQRDERIEMTASVGWRIPGTRERQWRPGPAHPAGRRDHRSAGLDVRNPGLRRARGCQHVRVHRGSAAISRARRRVPGPDRGAGGSRRRARHRRESRLRREGARVVPGRPGRDADRSCGRLRRSGSRLRPGARWLERRRRRRCRRRRPARGGREGRLRRRRRHRRTARGRHAGAPHPRRRRGIRWRRRRQSGARSARAAATAAISRARRVVPALGAANPASGGKGGSQTAGGYRGPERLRSVGDRDGGGRSESVATAPRRRERRRRWRRRSLRRRRRRLQPCPSAAATAAAARDSGPTDTVFRAGVRAGPGGATITYDRDQDGCGG